MKFSSSPNERPDEGPGDENNSALNRSGTVFLESAIAKLILITRDARAIARSSCARVRVSRRLHTYVLDTRYTNRFEQSISGLKFELCDLILHLCGSCDCMILFSIGRSGGKKSIAHEI